jgi:acetyltransferase-like isoleucine patch superfamily enzyme
MVFYQRFARLIQMIWILLTCPNVKIAKSSRIFGSFKISNKSKITIGSDSRVDSLEVIGCGELIIRNSVNIKNLFVNFGEDFSRVIIDDNVFVGSDSKFIIFGELKIGQGTLIAPEVLIVDTKHLFGGGRRLRESGVSIDNINIEKNIWIGAKSIILPGVNISSNVVIAAGSIVNKNCESDSVYGGNPAKKIKDIQ